MIFTSNTCIPQFNMTFTGNNNLYKLTTVIKLLPSNHYLPSSSY